MITRDIKKAKSKNPDITILFLHWGTEYDTVPSKSQTDLAEYFFSIGVDLVIGSHPHVLAENGLVKKYHRRKRWNCCLLSGQFYFKPEKTKNRWWINCKNRIYKRMVIHLKFQMQDIILPGSILQLKNTGKSFLFCHVPSLKTILISSVNLMNTPR